ncbi:MAG: hypothetical protein JWN64_582 [Parcubacteria group bacterium]|nr:hypothetical protein [Parcubacteria group bacterium]
MAGNFIDTSVLISFFNEKDSLHERAQLILREIQKPLLVHEYVVLETATVLMNRVGKSSADEFMRITLGNADFELHLSSEVGFLASAETFVQNQNKLSFVDTALLSLSGTSQIITFDEELNRAIKKRKEKKD